MRLDAGTGGGYELELPEAIKDIDAVWEKVFRAWRDVRPRL